MFASSGRESDQDLRLLLVEDDPAFAVRVHSILSDAGKRRFEVAVVRNIAEAMKRLSADVFHVVLLDLYLPDMQGLTALSRTQVAAPSLPIVVMTDRDDENLALQAVRAGAQDYLVKEKWDPQLLIRTLLHAVERNRMVQELRETRRRQHYLATHDGLTGLHNRSAFEENLQRAVAYSDRHDKRVALFFLDLDGFKSVNDSFGHSAGDKVLKEIGARLDVTIRKSDMAARLGGDEFVAMVQDLKRAEDAARVARSLLERISSPIEMAGVRLRVTGSVGIAFYPDDAADSDSLIRSADVAMYHAKSEGKNRFEFFSGALGSRIAERIRLEENVNGALENGELLTLFQPVRDVASGSWVRAEAKVSWPDSRLGAGALEELFSETSESGVVATLWDWILRSSCDQCRKWIDRGYPDIKVSVRTSVVQVELGQLPVQVEKVLEDFDLDPSALELELPARAFREGDLSGPKQLERLHEIGVSLCLSEFGTGGSSLPTLRDLPIRRVKLGRELVSGLPGDSGDSGLAAAVIGLAHSMGKRVVATEVDEQEQVSVLSALGCDDLVGNAVSPPLAADDLLAQLQAEPGRSSLNFSPHTYCADIGT